MALELGRFGVAGALTMLVTEGSAVPTYWGLGGCRVPFELRRVRIARALMTMVTEFSTAPTCFGVDAGPGESHARAIGVVMYLRGHRYGAIHSGFWLATTVGTTAGTSEMISLSAKGGTRGKLSGALVT